MSNYKGEIRDYDYSKNSFYEKSQVLNNSKLNPFIDNKQRKNNDFFYLNSTNADTNSKNNNDHKSNNYNPYTNNLMKNQLESSLNMKNDVEIEAINMLKAQKEKIQELVMEVDRRDRIIESLTKHDLKIEEEKLNIEVLKRQIAIFEDKLKLQQESEKKQLDAFSIKLTDIQESEYKLRQQVVSKDKFIHDLESKLKEKSDNLNNSKKQIVELESNNIELKSDLNEIAVQFKSLSAKLLSKEEELNDYKTNLNSKYLKTLEEKDTYEDKLTQLVDIVKQQSKELKEFDKNINQLESTNKSLLKQNDSMNNELLLKSKEINRFEAEMRNLKSQILEKNDQASYEKTQIDKLRAELDKLSKSSGDKDNMIHNLSTEKDEMLNYVNQELDAIKQWIDTYLGVYFDLAYDLPNLPRSFNKKFKEMFLLEKLKDSLSNCRTKLNEDLNKINISNNELKQEVSDYLQEKENYIQEKSILKTDIVKKQEEILELNILVEAMQRTILTQDSNLKKNDKSESINKIISEIFSLFNIDHSPNTGTTIDNIKSLEYFIRNYLNENNINNNSLEASKSEYRIYEKIQAEFDVKVIEIENRCNIHINSLEDKINQLNAVIRNKEMAINDLINDNNSLKSTIYDLKSQINNFENSNNLINAGNYNELESLKNQLDFYINKCKNLENENEFKKVQIKNQEEMIARREVLNNNSSNTNTKPSIQIHLKDWEKEKEKLIKDNISLMKLNVQLSNQIKQLISLNMNEQH